MTATTAASRPVRVHGGRVDHHARERRPGRWQILCGFLPVHPVHPDDFDRPLCGTPCTACARAQAKAADPAGAALRSHRAAVQHRESTGRPSLPGSDPRPGPTAERDALPPFGTDTAHDRRVRARLAELAAERGVSTEALLTQLNAAFRSGQSALPESVLPAGERPTPPPQHAAAARVVAQRAADDVWAVVSVTGDGVPTAAARPCGGAEPCPWRRDAPPGQFPAAAYELSEPTSRPGSTRRFGCHSSTPASPRMCAGWLLRGADGNAEVQDLLATGRLARPDLPDGVELYDSYFQMAAANGATLAAPAHDRDAAPDTADPHQDPA
ncbi:DUF6283 family protein [Streptomyces goshikiensis]